MPVSGPAPKGSRLTRHRNPLAHDWVDVADVPFGDGPALPAKMPNGATWPSWTRRWWKAFSRMPHCTLWAPSDWEFAFDTAALKAQFHSGGNAAMAAEIRNRERVLGTTIDARRALRVRYVKQQAAEGSSSAEVMSLDDYRDL